MAITVLATADGILDDADKAALDELEGRLKQGKSRILLYLHGGLVNEENGRIISQKLSKEGKTSLNVPNEWEQIYVVWRTGALETLRENWADIFSNQRLYKVLFKRILEAVANKVKVGSPEGRAISGDAPLRDPEIERRLNSGNAAPFDDLDSNYINADGARAAIVADDEDFAQELQLSLQFDAELNSIAEDIGTRTARKTNDSVREATIAGDAAGGEEAVRSINPSIKANWDTVEPDGSARLFSLGGALIVLVKHGVNIGVNVLHRLRKKRDHGLHATIAEEIVRELYGDLIGSIVWGMMVKDAADHFKDGGLGSRLLAALGTGSHQITAVGHSAGSIWLTEFMKSAGARDKPFELNLFLLAPAVRTLSFSKALAAFGTNVDLFRMFVMGDDLERKDPVLGKKLAFIYPSSLLYLVSGLFEISEENGTVDAPLLGLSRFLDETPFLTETDEMNALKVVKDFLATKANSVIRSESSAGSGLNSASHSHGGFDDDESTLASLATFMR